MILLKFLKVGGILLVLFGISYGGYHVLFQDTPTQKTSINSTKEISEPDIKTVFPSLSKNFSTLLLSGTLRSNETGKIFTRADGIVKDIYVEVGDKVKAGQTLASLLPHGVEGEAETIIAEKRAMRDKAKVEYESALKLATASRSTSQTNVDTTNIRESSNVAFTKQSILLSKTSLENTKKLLDQTKKTQEAQLSEAENEITQTVKQAIIAGNNAFQTANKIIFTDRSNLGSINISESNLSQYYGALNSSTRSKFATSYNQAREQKNTVSTLDAEAQKNAVISYFSIIDQLLTNTEALLRATVSNMDISQSMLDTGITEIHDAQESLAMAREKFTNAVQSKTVLEKEQESSLTELENTVKEQEAMIASNTEAVKLAQADQSRNSLLAEKEKTQTEVERNTDIAKMGAELALAEAALASELTKSGHQVIKAPFNGVIAKRNIRIGDTVMNTDAAFEVVQINSALAKNAKAVVQFGAPEDLFNIINEGNEVEIVVPGQENQSYTAMVTSKSSLIDPASRVFTLLATIKDDVFLPDNSNVRVRVATEKNPAWQVSSRSIKRMDGENYIWLLGEDNNPQKILITLLAEDGEFADIRGENLGASSKVILDPPDSFLKKKIEEKKDFSEAPMSH